MHLRADYVKKLLVQHGMHTEDEKVLAGVHAFITRVVSNILCNVGAVLEVTKQKTATAKHFGVLLDISKNPALFARQFAKKNPIQDGGDPVLPSEYFGGDSGRYTADLAFQTSYSDIANGIARPEMVDSFGQVLLAGGGIESIPKTVLAAIIREGMQALARPYKLSKEAKTLLAQTLDQNLERFLMDLKKVSKQGDITFPKLKKVRDYRKYSTM